MKTNAISTIALTAMIALSVSMGASADTIKHGDTIKHQANATNYEQAVNSDVRQARLDLAHNHTLAATSDAGKAETLLLNASQAKIYSNPSALSSLERAHDELNANDPQHAEHDLMLAQQNLPHPG